MSATRYKILTEANIEDSIVDGHTTIAPSGNAVYDALALKAPIDSPIFTGTPTLPTGTIATTQSANNNSTKLATTAYVDRSNSMDIVFNLSSANILGMFATPIEVIPAPGANKLIILESCVFKLTYNSVQYTGGGTVALRQGSNGNNLILSVITNTFVNGSVDTINQSNATSSGVSRASNDNIVITNTIGAFMNGNSTATLYIRYHIVDIS